RAAPVRDVDELELGTGADRLVQRGIPITRLRGEVVAGLLPRGDEPVGLVGRDLESVDQRHGFGHNSPYFADRTRDLPAGFRPGRADRGNAAPALPGGAGTGPAQAAGCRRSSAASRSSSWSTRCWRISIWAWSASRRSALRRSRGEASARA